MTPPYHLSKTVEGTGVSCSRDTDFINSPGTPATSVFGDVLVASPADAGGRGISLTVRQNGAAANLTGATVYFVWCHKVTGERGTEPFSAVDASSGTFEVYYPAAMQEAEGAVQAQVMVSRGDDSYISSRVFTIRVEPVVIGGEEH